MRYISTRGLAPAVPFCDVLLAGLAPDGGLYVPETYPKMTTKELAALRYASYSEVAFKVLSRFIDDIPPADLLAICDKTYTAENFKHSRNGADPKQIVPLTWLWETTSRLGNHGLGILELSNGPTLAFKDLGLQLLGNLFEYVLAKRDETLNVLGATSGDTGSAAEYALRGKKGINVFMLSPEGKMSPFQRAQMYSLLDSNIYNIAVRGMFDDAQDVVKAVSNDAEFKAEFKIGAVNSINLARIIAQVVYYVWGYLRATDRENSCEKPIDFAVPTGNFGNICAGHVAREMGIPIRMLILATNENDVLHEFFRTGVYRPRKAADVSITSSPSMDISKASNFERFIYDLVASDSKRVRELFSSSDGFNLSGDAHFRSLQKRYPMPSHASTHLNRLSMIRTTWEKYCILIDPHTADAMAAASYHFRPNEEVSMIVLETAQPCKFDETILEATRVAPKIPQGLVGIEDLPQRVVVMNPDPGEVKQFIRDHCA